MTLNFIAQSGLELAILQPPLRTPEYSRDYRPLPSGQAYPSLPCHYF